MNASKLSKSTRKFIRVEKSRICRETSGVIEQDRLINELYKRSS